MIRLLDLHYSNRKLLNNISLEKKYVTEKNK